MGRRESSPLDADGSGGQRRHGADVTGKDQRQVLTPSVCEFPGGTSAPGDARAFAADALRAVLGGPPPPVLLDDLMLVVSELVTNAVRAGSRTVWLSVTDEDGHVAVQVRDEAGGWPQQRDAGARDTNGRGLALVSAVSVAWGVRLAAGGDGKIVWAHLAVPA